MKSEYQRSHKYFAPWVKEKQQSCVWAKFGKTGRCHFEIM
jgi:hypothetical protein